MLQINTDIGCCGIQEIEDISYNTENPERTIGIVAKTRFDDQCSCAFYIFSDTNMNKKKAGKNLAKYIKKHKLGTITKPTARINPNTGHSVTMWIWSVNKAKFKEYWNKKAKDFYQRY